MDDLETKVAVLCQRVDTLEGVVIDEKRRLNGNLERINKRLEAMDDKLQAVTSQALQKPSWGVTVAIGGLLSLATGLAVFLLTH